jgi:hypothetical protein
LDKPSVSLLARSELGTRFRAASLLGGTKQRRKETVLFAFGGERPRNETLLVALA